MPWLFAITRVSSPYLLSYHPVPGTQYLQESLMIYLNVMLTVKMESDIDKVRGLLARLTAAARTEPGCSRFEIYHSLNDRRHFTLVERWESQQHLDQHRRAKAFRELYEPEVLPLVDRTPHPGELIA